MAPREVIRDRAVADGGGDRDRSAAAPGVTPGSGADPTRCGCAGKTPLDGVVFPARRRVSGALDGTSVRLGPVADAATLADVADDGGIERAVDVVALGEERPAVPFGGDGDVGGTPVVTLACAFVGDDLAEAERLGDALASAYAGLDGPEVTIGKGHAVQVPGLEGGLLWLEHLRSTAGGDPVGTTRRPSTVGPLAANVDAVHAFPGLGPPEQARIAALNACNDVYAAGATADRVVRPVVAVPAGVDPRASQVTDWYRAGLPSDVRVLRASVLAHDGTGWLLGASVTARGGVDSAEPPIPEECGVLVTRPPGGLAAFALGSLDGDRGLRRSGRDRLTRDTRSVAAVLSACRPDPGESFDPARHLARVTDVSGEGIAEVGRLLARDGRSLRLDRLPVLPGVADAAGGRWTLPDVTVETNGPFAAVGTPSALARATDRLRDVTAAAPVRIGTVDGSDVPIRNAVDADPSRLVESAARWPTAEGER